jgi:hypothetical protein
METEYPIIYEPSFVLFWGFCLAFAEFTGGIMMIALVALMLLVLVHHEHAHAKECLKRGVKIEAIKFFWLGGCVQMGPSHYNDAIPILTAGVFNTFFYAGIFSLTWFVVMFCWQYLIVFNRANNPYISLLDSAILFSIAMAISNVLPLEYNSNKYGIISTDGWAAFKFRELRDELWNDGKTEAIAQV